MLKLVTRILAAIRGPKPPAAKSVWARRRPTLEPSIYHPAAPKRVARWVAGSEAQFIDVTR